MDKRKIFDFLFVFLDGFAINQNTEIEHKVGESWAGHKTFKVTLEPLYFPKGMTRTSLSWLWH